MIHLFWKNIWTHGHILASLTPVTIYLFKTKIHTVHRSTKLHRHSFTICFPLMCPPLLYSPELNTSCLQPHSSSQCTVLIWQKQHEYYCLLISMKSHQEYMRPPLGGSLSVCGPRAVVDRGNICAEDKRVFATGCTCVCGLSDVSIYVISEH